MLTEKEIYDILSEILDPEIPVITIKDLGILQCVEVSENGCVVYITPTYSGCPAMKMIEDQIQEALAPHRITSIKVKLIYSPAWTTDWISAEAKEKLRIYGIAPPEHSSVDKGCLIGKAKELKCPLCNSKKTQMISQFGSTACKALYRCMDCKEPFDYFKCI